MANFAIVELLWISFSCAKAPIVDPLLVVHPKNWKIVDSSRNTSALNVPRWERREMRRYVILSYRQTARRVRKMKFLGGQG